MRKLEKVKSSSSPSPSSPAFFAVFCWSLLFLTQISMTFAATEANSSPSPASTFQQDSSLVLSPLFTASVRRANSNVIFSTKNTPTAASTISQGKGRHHGNKGVISPPFTTLYLVLALLNFRCRTYLLW